MANNNRLRVVARKQLSLSSTFCIFVLTAELRLAGRWQQAEKKLDNHKKQPKLIFLYL